MAKAIKNQRKGRKQGRPTKEASSVGRDALIAATRELTKTIPAGQITRLDIARAAGVDPALIRYYFGDKSELMVAAVLQAGADLHERQSRAQAKAMSPSEKVKERVTVLLEALYEDPSLHHLILERIIHSKSKAARDLRHDMVHGTCAKLAAVINEGVATGEFRRVDPRHLFLATVGACSFPMGERALFEELMGEPINDQHILAYSTFLSDVFLAGLSAIAGSGKKPRTAKSKSD